jgi:hypothetical protein
MNNKLWMIKVEWINLFLSIYMYIILQRQKQNLLQQKLENGNFMPKRILYLNLKKNYITVINHI